MIALALGLPACAESTQDPLGPPCRRVVSGDGGPGARACPSIVSYRVLPQGSVRWLNVSGGQLYGTSDLAPIQNVFTVGSGAPTAATQTLSALPGMPAASGSPYGFALFNRLADVPGPDTLYVADDRAPADGGGILKWQFDGSAWSLVETLSVGSIDAGFRGVAGFASPTGVTLVATTAEPPPNRIVLIVDDGSASPTASVVATAAPDTVWRGIAPSPHL